MQLVTEIILLKERGKMTEMEPAVVVYPNLWAN